MPVNIGEMTSDTTVFEGQLPLDPKQIDKLVELVLERLEEKQRESQDGDEATNIRRQAAPPMWAGE